jgi:hypothetical protein
VAALRVSHPPGYPAERAYALKVVLSELLGIEFIAAVEEREDVLVSLRDGGSGELSIAEGLFATIEEDWLNEAALPRTPLAKLDARSFGLEHPGAGSPLPVLFGEPTATGGLPVDVFGSAFFMLTRYEEAVRRTRDVHGRFPANASIAYREGFLERPIVNEYAELLWAALQSVWPRLERRRRTFRFRPTHDVDWPLSPMRPPSARLKTLGGDLVRRRDPLLALDRLRAERRRRRGDVSADMNNTFDYLMDASEAHGLRSAFYFMAGTGHGRDGGYVLDDPWISSLMRRIHKRGHEIGLHPSYDSYRNPELVKRELEVLMRACARLDIEQPRWGGRQHFLRWETPTTWQAWEEAGLDYDSTVGFAGAAGFRAGVCVEYPVFNLQTRRELALRERPLTVMDGSLFDYARLSRGEARRKAGRLRDRCRMFGGDFVLLWHNSSLQSRRDRRLYSQLLADG